MKIQIGFALSVVGFVIVACVELRKDGLQLALYIRRYSLSTTSAMANKLLQIGIRYNFVILIFFFSFQITRLGFRSVAHYLIQTRRSQTNLENDQGSNKSLPSPGMSLHTESKESLKVDDVNNGLPLSENEESPKVPKVDDGHIGLPLAENKESPKVGIPKPQSEDKKVDGHDSGKEIEVHFSDEKNANSKITLESCTKVKRSNGPSPDSISLMLRQRKHNNSNVQSSMKREEALNVKQVASNACSESKSEFSMLCPASTTPNSDCIAGRLRSRFRTI